MSQLHVDHFNRVWAQYDNQDRKICDRHGSLVQGFVRKLFKDSCSLWPFMLLDMGDFDKLKRYLAALPPDEIIDIAFARTYLHYGDRQPPSSA